MHPKVEQALEEIDAALLNGDTFEEPEDLDKLRAYLERWTRETSSPPPTPVAPPPWAEAPSASLKWVRVDKPWRLFRDEAKPGMVIRLASDPTTSVLIGDVAENGGYCGHCAIREDDVVRSVLDLRVTIAIATRGADLL